MSTTMRAVAAAALLMAVTSAASASTFCGCNGRLVLSFAGQPELVSTVAAEADENGLVTVDVFAVLSDVQPVEGPGGVLLAIGGFEFELRITGAEPLSVAKKITVPHRDFGQRPTQVWAGTAKDGERIDKGPLTLCHWTIVFKGAVSDVRFDLDPAGLLSCEGLPQCGECGATVLYTGSMNAAQEGYLFGASVKPAVLNPTGEPDLAETTCGLSVTDVGVFAPHKRMKR